MTSKTYDVLAIIGRRWLPALATLYGVVGKIWGLPYIVEIPATLTALAVFINEILKKDSETYFDGKVIVEKDSAEFENYEG